MPRRVVERISGPTHHHWSDVLRDESLAREARTLANAHGLSAELQRTLTHDTSPWDAAANTLVFTFLYGRCVRHQDKWIVEALLGTPAREAPDFGYERPVKADFRWIESTNDSSNRVEGNKP